jgi:hypothetical protein
MDRETLDYLLGLVLDERIRLDRRVWVRGEEGTLRSTLYRRNDDARRAVIDALEDVAVRT